MLNKRQTSRAMRGIGIPRQPCTCRPGSLGCAACVAHKTVPLAQSVILNATAQRIVAHVERTTGPLRSLAKVSFSVRIEGEATMAFTDDNRVIRATTTWLFHCHADAGYFVSWEDVPTNFPFWALQLERPAFSWRGKKG